MKTSAENIDPISLLKGAGLKATPGKLNLVKLLLREHKPLTVVAIKAKLPSKPKKINTVTLYRNLEDMVVRGLVRKVDFQHPHAHYELVAGRKHHHHMVCGDCGIIEDIEICRPDTFEKTALKNSKKFRAIRTHSIEFFGICKKCAA